MDATVMRRRISDTRVARLATTGAGGRPHIVPITFAIERESVYFAVDAKPKRTPDLQRLRNITTNPAVSVLFDHYEEDWRKLWWVRVEGSARILGDEAEAQRAIDLLVGRYEQYRRARPGGPVVAISIERMTGWSPA